MSRQHQSQQPDAGRETQVSGVRSTAALGGHPIHPMLIPLPIGALVGVLATDVVFLLTDDRFWAQASWWLLWAGLVTGVAAAAVGLVDFLTIHRVRSHRAGKVHLLANVVGLTLVGVNLVVRSGDLVDAVLPWGIVLTLAMNAAIGIGGWFGGELSYRHGVGVTGH